MGNSTSRKTEVAQPPTAQFDSYSRVRTYPQSPIDSSSAPLKGLSVREGVIAYVLPDKAGLRCRESNAIDFFDLSCVEGNQKLTCGDEVSFLFNPNNPIGKRIERVAVKRKTIALTTRVSAASQPVEQVKNPANNVPVSSKSGTSAKQCAPRVALPTTSIPDRPMEPRRKSNITEVPSNAQIPATPRKRSENGSLCRTYSFSSKPAVLFDEIPTRQNSVSLPKKDMQQLSRKESSASAKTTLSRTITPDIGIPSPASGPSQKVGSLQVRADTPVRTPQASSPAQSVEDLSTASSSSLQTCSVKSTITCRIVQIKGDYLFAQPQEKMPSGYSQSSVFVSLKKLKFVARFIKLRDIVEVNLASEDKKSPFGIRAHVHKFAERSYDEIVNIIRAILNDINGNSTSAMQDPQDRMNSHLLGLQSLWECVFGFDNKQMADSKVFHFFEMKIRLANAVCEKFRTQDPFNLRRFFEAVFANKCFSPVKGRSLMLIKSCGRTSTSLKKDLKTFLTNVAMFCPCKVMVPLKMVHLVCNDSEKWLVECFKSYISGSQSDELDSLEWSELPMVPVADEMIGSVMESEENLSIVPIGTKFESVEEYFDTYVRLLREDCFSTLKTCIKKFFDQSLDARDMNMYFNVSFEGYSLSQKGIIISFSMNKASLLKGSIKGSDLQGGSLLGISPCGTFRDCIWGTVFMRSDKVDASGKFILAIELIRQFQTKSLIDIILSVVSKSGNLVIAESPTYYRAYEPVLKALQSSNLKEMPFQEELVHLEKSTNPPKYLNVTSRFNMSRVSFCQKSQILSFDQLKREVMTSFPLDDSQKRAMISMLHNRIAIVQGPPGTGKTHLGVKLVETLLACDSIPDAPILVLTYKNHALDEFLLHIGKAIGMDKICRVGGRSNEPDLRDVTLKELKDAALSVKGGFLKNLKASKFDLKKDIESTSKDLDAYLKKSTKLCKISPMDFLKEYFKDYHLMNLILDVQSWNVPKKMKFETIKNSSCLRKRDMQEIMSSVRDAMDKHGVHSLQVLLTRKIPSPVLRDFVKLAQSLFFSWLPDEAYLKKVEAELSQTFVPGQHLSSKSGHDPHADDDEDLIDDERKLVAQTFFKDINDLMKNTATLPGIKKNQASCLTLLPFAKKLCQSQPDNILGMIQNPWSLDQKQRLIAVQSIILKLANADFELLDRCYQDYQSLCSEKESLDRQIEATIIRSRRVVGMTITGASINREMIQMLKPAIVVVEEAAEVLEPQIAAILGPHVEHLIMIGDHEQLRPSVESYELKENYKFDVSMMERLIAGKLNYATLQCQNRMRPSISQYLRDIYPNLKDGDRVQSIKCPSFLANDVFFWAHDVREINDRSYKNEEEAERAVKLAMLFIRRNIQPSQITLLASYRGQSTLIRDKLDSLQQANKKEIFFDRNNRDSSIKVSTIDMYQGDENDIVIVSLVRSNEAGKVGFLKERNRRCVAQSRARKALILIGNPATVRRANCWSKTVASLECDGKLGVCLPLKCLKHPRSLVNIRDAKGIPSVYICKQTCEEPMSCGRHKCKSPCEPSHSHTQCNAAVPFRCAKCAGEISRKCCQRESDVKCHHKEPIMCLTCKKWGEKLCSDSASNFKCKGRCLKIVKACGHPCEKLCHEPCPTTKEDCPACQKIENERAEKVRRELIEKHKAMADRFEKELAEAKKKGDQEICTRVNLDPDGETSGEYLDVEDKVMKSIQRAHNWYPHVTKIEKVKNPLLTAKFHTAITKMFDPSYIAEKFHGTSKEAVDAIVKTGFIASKEGMYGAGGYLATDSSKSAQEIYTKHSNMLLLCKAGLGRTKLMTSACNHANAEMLKREKFDSIFAKRGTKGSGGVLFDEFVIFNTDLVLPLYVIHFNISSPTSLGLAQSIGALPGSTSGGYKRIELQHSRQASDPRTQHFQIAAAQFYALTNGQGYAGPRTISKIFYHLNPVLENKFKAQEAVMKGKYSWPDSDYILAFHGTPNPANIDSIMRNNFDLNRVSRTAHGFGIYFSEFPDVSMGYAGGSMKLIICKLLPGKSRDGDCGMGQRCVCDSHRVQKDAQNRGQMIVMTNMDRVLPCYELNLT